MALRSPLLLILVLAVTIALPLLLVTRSRGTDGARARTMRGATIVVAQLTAIAVAALAVNDYAYFFGSWSELFGQAASTSAPHREAKTPLHLTIERFGSRASPLAVTSTSVATDRAAYPRPRQAGLVTSFSLLRDAPTQGGVYRMLTRAAAGVRMTDDVYLPPPYFAAHGRPARWPVLEVFGPPHESPDSLIFRPPLPGLLLRSLQLHDSRPVVLVLVAPPVSCARQSLDYYARRLPAQVAATFRIRTSTVVPIGLGAGAACAMPLGLAQVGGIHTAVSLLGCAPLGDIARRHPAVQLLWAPPLHSCRGAQPDALARVSAPSSVDEVVGYPAVAKPGHRVWRSLLSLTFRWLGGNARGGG
jgi:hypothetical protein